MKEVIGRIAQIDIFKEVLVSGQSEFIAVTGRRREFLSQPCWALRPKAGLLGSNFKYKYKFKAQIQIQNRDFDRNWYATL